MYFLYGAPFEVLIAGFSLYKYVFFTSFPALPTLYLNSCKFLRLLGLSAFAGFIVFVVLWPLNAWVTKKRITIHKELFAAKDTRMGVLSELVGAVSSFPPVS